MSNSARNLPTVVDVVSDLEAIRTYKWPDLVEKRGLRSLFDLLPDDDRPDRLDSVATQAAIRDMLLKLVDRIRERERAAPPQTDQSIAVAAEYLLRLRKGTEKVEVDALWSGIGETWKYKHRSYDEPFEMQGSSIKEGHRARIYQDLASELIAMRRQELAGKLDGSAPVDSNSSTPWTRHLVKWVLVAAAFVLAISISILGLVDLPGPNAADGFPRPGSVVDAGTGELIATSDSQLPEPTIPTGYLLKPLNPLVRNLANPEEWVGVIPDDAYVRARAGDTVEVYSRLINASGKFAVQRVHLVASINPVQKQAKRHGVALAAVGLTVTSPGVAGSKQNVEGPTVPRTSWAGAFMVRFADGEAHPLTYVNGSAELLDLRTRVSNPSAELEGGFRRLAQLPDDVFTSRGLTIANLGIEPDCWACRTGLARYVRFRLAVGD